MEESSGSRRFRFGAFEADELTGELHRKGMRVKLNAQPFQVLLLLLGRPGELLTREEIARVLWPEGTFVDFEHGVNSSVNRIREALGDTASNPRFVETLARRGYRFIAPVERVGEAVVAVAAPAEVPAASGAVVDALPTGSLLDAVLATPADLPVVSHGVVQTLFVLLQAMYAGFYVGALANLREIDELLSPLRYPTAVLSVLLLSAALLIPVRAYLASAALLYAPGARGKLLRVWPVLLPCDILWALAPFLLLHHVSFGLALACTALLVYAPFAQRSLILMGAGEGGARSRASST